MNEPLPLCTLAIIAITAASSFQGFRSPAFQDKYIFWPERILRDKEYFRLVTCGFLHADWMHFFFNAFSLYCFGRYLELFFGFVTLLLIYFGSILGGSLLSLYLHRYHDYRALGASGGGCGVVFASIFLLPGSAVYVFPLPFAIPAWLYAIVFIIASFLGIRHQVGNIGHDAHLGGAIIGLLITTALYPGIVPQSPLLYAAVLALAVSLFVYLWLKPLYLPAGHSGGRWRSFISETSRRQPPTKRSEQQEMDRLLDKISQFGMDSLSPRERERLERFSRRQSADEPGED